MRETERKLNEKETQTRRDNRKVGRLASDGEDRIKEERGSER